ncbi:hypothetical protein [Roseovarius indicus]|uniref:Peptidase S74 domain-containing protein n=1 Tax=Roseovarius indicus TaxID=540747 RepID=A0A0T5P9S2_9RHOB|nr:hypothetical protein [Roseovarius indicus]KRS17853.1 hypothetical protein XM52_09785 [Roseovarius indicus]QEW27350.1 hypothetical protein RIdsm_03162 [Roseovarius indicus]SFD49916.1 hypothetical protein SAMN04488031_101184 [Roseovarius indicus]
MSFIIRTAFPLAIALAAAPAWAQDVIGDDLVLSGDITQNGFGPNFFDAAYSSFSGSMCLGNNCTTSEANGLGNPPLKLKWSEAAILFEDTSSSSFADRDWRIAATGSASQETFQIQDWGADWSTGTATAPFVIVGDAPANALWLDHTGNIGFGTSLPQADLHVIGASSAALRMEATSGTSRTWQANASEASFWIADVTANTTPFALEANTPNDTLWLASTGFVGIGTASPDAPLEVSNDDTFSYFRITAEQAAINQSADMTFTGGPLGTGEFRYNIVDGDGPEMKLNANGDMEIDGTLTTGGPTCAGGCDAVFDAEFERLSVTDHAALMWDKGHLPAVGPTLPGEAFNVTEKMGAMLNELEHAHIYIEELHAELGAQKAEKSEMQAQIAALTARLDALEVAE